ncbi:MAG: hypothetical protein ABFS41_04380 [Myxococcota bacterium]
MDVVGSLRRLGRTLFTVDLRSLALVRILLGTLILVDLASRARLLTTNYTDLGAHPRIAVLSYREPGSLPSLHLLSGSADVQAALFGLAALVALALVLGWHTRIATTLSWLLAISLQGRHELLLDGGDHALRHLLFWCMFLPLGAWGSLDARRRGRPPPTAFVCSPASAALLLQGASLFLVTGLVKTGPEWTTDWTAVRYAISREGWIRPFGEWLVSHPFLPELLTPIVRWWEIAGPLLLFVPVAVWLMRAIGIAGIWGMLLGLGLGLKLNLFPFIAGSGLIAFLPGALWDRLGLRVSSAPPATDDAPGRVRAAARLAGRLALVALLLLLVVWMNARTVNHALAPPEPLQRFATRLQMGQGWMMYAPSPRHVDVQFAHRGLLANGAEIDLDRAPATGPAWEEVRRAWQDYRFLYFLQKLYAPRWHKPLDEYALWLCRRWNADARGGGRLVSVNVASVSQEIVLGDAPAPPPETLTRTTALCPR